MINTSVLHHRQSTDARQSFTSESECLHHSFSTIASLSSADRLVRMRALTLVLTHALLLLLTPSSVRSAFRYTSPIDVGVLYPYALDVNNVQVPLSLALADLNASGSLSNLSVALHYADSGQQPVQATAAALSLVDRVGTLTAMIGDYRDNSTMALAYLSTGLKIPLINPLASSALLSDRANCIYTTRMILNHAATGAAITSLLKTFNWLRIAILYSDDDYGRGVMDQMVQNPFDATNSDISVFSVPADPSLSAPIIESVMSQILDLDIRIIVMHSTTTLNILQQADEMGVLGAPRTWIGTDMCTEANIAALGSKLIGSICFQSTTPSSDLWDDFAQRIVQQNSTLYPSVDLVPLSAGLVYDSLFLLVSALNVMNVQPTSVSSVVGANLFNAINAQQITGVTGVINFPGSCSSFPATCTGMTGDRHVNFTVVNYDEDSNTYVARGQYSNETGKLTIAYNNQSQSGMTPSQSSYSQLVWSDGSSSVPKDRARVYAVGDSLATSSDSRILVLAFAVSAFGSWTTLLLIEMAVFIKQRPSPSSSMASQNVRNHSWLAWIALAALVFGIASCWGPVNLVFLALNLEDFPIYVNLREMIGSIVLLPVVFVPCFLLIMRSIQPRVPGSEDSTTVDSSIRLSSTTNGDRTRRTSETGTMASTTSESSRLVGSQVSKSVHRRWYHKIKKIRPLFVLSVAIISGAIQIQTWLSSSSLTGPGSPSMTFSLLVAGSVVCMVCGLPTFFTFFFLSTSKFRMIAAFVMAAIVEVSAYIPYSSFTAQCVTLVGNYDASASYLAESSQTFSILVAAGCLSLCLVAMMANVVKLRTSRNMLDRLSTQVQKQIDILEQQIQQHESQRVMTQEQTAAIRRSIEVINLCRPLPRPYALPLALAANADSATNNTAVANKSAKLSIVPPTADGPSATTSGAPALDTPVSMTRDISEPSVSSAFQPRSMHRIRALTALTTMTAVQGKKNEAQVQRLWDELGSDVIRAGSTRMTDTPARPIPFTTVLSHPVSLELLKDVANKQLSSESLALWFTIQRYRSLTETASRSLLADKIYSQFIANGAPVEVNLSAAMKEAISRRLGINARGGIGSDSGNNSPLIGSPTTSKKSPSLGKHVFDDVEQEILKLIHTNHRDDFDLSYANELALCVLRFESEQRAQQIQEQTRERAKTVEAA